MRAPSRDLTNAVIAAVGPQPGKRRRSTVLRAGTASSVQPARITAAFDGAPAVVVSAENPSPSATDELDVAYEAAYSEGLVAGRAAGFDAGHAEGFAAGGADAAAAATAVHAAAQADVARALAALRDAAETFNTRQVTAAAEIEDIIASLAFQLAESIVGRELEVATNPGLDAIARALRLAPDRCAAVVRINPTDADTVGDLAQVIPGRDITVVADPAVTAGGAIVEADGCDIDAQLDAALARTRAALGLAPQ